MKGRSLEKPPSRQQVGIGHFPVRSIASFATTSPNHCSNTPLVPEALSNSSTARPRGESVPS